MSERKLVGGDGMGAAFEIPDIQPLGDSATRVSFGDTIDPATHARARGFCRAAQVAAPDGVIECVAAYATVVVYFDPLRTDHDTLVSQLREIAGAIPAEAEAEAAIAARMVEIPVAYGGAFGPDLDELARGHGMAAEAAIALHASAEYRVYFLGFAPGFAYLGGLPEALATPRLATPRAVVPAGSVGIAGSQTGVYPLATPAGWRIIGRTPLVVHDPARNPPSLLASGDIVRFRPIDAAEFGMLRDEHGRRPLEGDDVPQVLSTKELGNADR